MRMQYGAGSYRASLSSNLVSTRYRAEFETVCRFAALGLSLTLLLYALGYTQTIAQALAISG